MFVCQNNTLSYAVLAQAHNVMSVHILYEIILIQTCTQDKSILSNAEICSGEFL